MPTYSYPTPVELREIEQELLPRLTQDDPVFDEFPITEVNSNRLRWEQLDNFQGMQQVRGLGGAFKSVPQTGAKAYDFEPGVYGEFDLLEEAELTERRELGSFDQLISLNDLTSVKQMKLLQRRIDRIRYILWSLLSTGNYSVASKDGTVKHYGIFPLLTASAAVGWATVATAKPYSDLLALALKYRGQSVSFGRGSKLYLNRKFLNHLLTNVNPLDLFGRRTQYGATLNQLSDINQINEQNDLPSIVPYDEGYLSDGTDGQTAGTFVPFIPDNKAILIGKRTNGAKLGEYRMTRNANNPNLEPGPYTRVVDLGEIQSPRAIKVEDGHNGGPVIFFPGAIVVLTI
jgi:hypothetical protein